MILLVAAAAYPGGAAADEFYGLGGATTSVDRNFGSYSWQLGYTQDLAPHFAASVSYLNEGHLDNHRRDGYAVQFWGRTNLLDDHLTLGAGIGPYLAFDTQTTDGGYANRHSWQALTSVDATWRTDGALIFLIRSNYVAGGPGPDSLSAMVGIGAQFRNDPRNKTVELQRADNEIALMAGQTIVNSLGSSQSAAFGVEYRRVVIPHLEWTVSLLDEGENRQIERDGVASQLWVTQDLYHHRFTIGAGAGAYLDFGHHGGGSRFNGLIGLTGGYRMTPHWGFRAIWDRVVTDYDRDADLLLLGLAYRF
ncbi:hypothetical protein [Geomesophilobacter sediminis]|uniref:Uncharacterized protein n=1 Tax=Geomesophilobacter sediminis TaxID=2798584 RepID=A0A8J7IMI1_9BACT|nr:hypothetical protein [Geomesophilobacter sediminis]MBJ6723963.1 hypothetical protein [Geomesophilobacter sediminis]